MEVPNYKKFNKQDLLELVLLIFSNYYDISPLELRTLKRKGNKFILKKYYIIILRDFLKINLKSIATHLGVTIRSITYVVENTEPQFTDDAMRFIRHIKMHYAIVYNKLIH